MRKKVLLVFLFFCFFFIFPSGVHAATYYVAKNGNDSNSGTEAQPFLTVTAGVGVLSAGDTLYVKAGTYAESLQDVIPSGTSWSSPVTVAAFSGDSPILKPNSGANRVLYFSAGDDSYIIVDGFVLDGTNVGFEVIKITTGSHHIRIKNSELKNSSGTGILVTQSGSDNNEFLNLDIHDNGTAEFDHGIYLQTQNNLISGCAIYSNTGHGIHLFNGAPNNNTIRNNNVYSNADRGIGVYIGTGNIIYNNIVRDSFNGIHVANDAIDSEIYNNTVYSNTNAGIFIGDNTENVTLYNNIANNNAIGVSVASSATGITLKNNLLVGNDTDFSDASSVVTSSNTIFTEEAATPKFINPSGNNFDLQSTSPAIDVGITVAIVTTDLDGTARPQGSAYDIGAYEYTPAAPDTPTSGSAITATFTSSETTTNTGTAVSALSPTVKLTQTTTGDASVTGNQNIDGNILEFSGTAPANALISVKLTDDRSKTIPGIVKVNADGTWSWKPPLKLDPGDYTAIFTTQDEKGNIGSTTLNFAVDEYNFFGKILDFINNIILSLFIK